MKKQHYIIGAFLLIIFFVLIFDKPKNCDCTVEEIVYIDTTKGTIKQELPKPDTVYLPSDTIYIKDTAELIKDYFSEKVFQLEQKDANFRFVYDIVLKENTIQSATLNYELLNKYTYSLTTMKQPEKFSLSAGIGSTYYPVENIAGIDVLLAASFNRHTVLLKYDFIHKNISIGYTIKLFRRF